MPNITTQPTPTNNRSEIERMLGILPTEQPSTSNDTQALSQEKKCNISIAKCCIYSALCACCALCVAQNAACCVASCASSCVPNITNPTLSMLSGQIPANTPLMATIIKTWNVGNTCLDLSALCCCWCAMNCKDENASNNLTDCAYCCYGAAANVIEQS